MNSIFIQDTGSGVWTFVANDTGPYPFSLTMGGGPASPIFLNDIVLPNQSWKLVVDAITELLEVVPVPYSSSYPSSLSLTTQPHSFPASIFISSGVLEVEIIPLPVLPLDILSDVSLVLVEPLVETTLGTIITTPGVATVTPPDMDYIYVGATLVVGRGTPNVEAVAVTAITTNSFTAAFAYAHAAGDPLNGATFPTGLFSQAEMLEYLRGAESTFLVKVRPVFASATQALAVDTRSYPNPNGTIRIERVSSNGNAWTDTSQLVLDLDNQDWQSDETSGDPTAFFQDLDGLDQWGIYPLMQVLGTTAELWYSVTETANPLTFLSQFVLPQIFTTYLKYGTLARAFNKDGEQRDEMRARYCSKRFEFGVMLARMFLFASETMATEMEADQAQMKRFAPLLVEK